MAITNFIPEIWNAQMLRDFNAQAIAAALSNRQYEGDATKGNTVHITTAVDVAIKDYKAAGRTTSADPVSDAGQDLLIDQEKNFDFYIDDIDRAQAAGSMEAYTQSAAEGLVQDADKFLLNVAATQATTTTNSTTAAATAADAWDVIRDLRKAMDKLHVPLANRVAVVNAEFASLLLGYDSKITKANESASTAGLRAGSIGPILGFDIYQSENLPVTDKQQVVGFYRPSLAFVSQIEETEALRAQDKFADRLRGLHVYGGKVIRPDAVAVWNDTSV